MLSSKISAQTPVFIAFFSFITIPTAKSGLNDLILGSYGREDGLFANHQIDRERALQALIKANDEKVGFANYIEMHRQYLEKNGYPEDHILLQIEKVKEVKRYFNFD